MSIPFGIDFGNMHSVLAVARNKGVDIIINEVSNRTTPTVVGFGDRKRYIGEEGKSKQSSMLTNTVDNLQTLVGLNFNTTDFDHEKQFINAKLVKCLNDKVGVEVMYNGELHTFSATQLVAMYLNKVKHTVELDLKEKLNQVCIAVPLWYNEQKRIAVLDACKIIGLDQVQFVDNLTAAAVFYGMSKSDLPDHKGKPRIVGFYDCGYSTTSFSLVAFHQGEMKTISNYYIKNLGGRSIDFAITEHLAELFNSKYKIDIRQNEKAYYRVMNEAQKLKKVLSVNQVGQLNIESLMNDIDVSTEMTREEFEELIKPLFDGKIDGCINSALERAKLQAQDIDAIELLGGSTRVPYVKSLIEETVGLTVSSTLNQDEAIVKGAALISAMHSTSVQVKPFKFNSILSENISIIWNNQAPGESSSVDILDRTLHYPSKKTVVINVMEDFKLIALQGKKNVSSRHNILAKWKISGIEPSTDGNPVNVELKLSCDSSKFLHLDEACVVQPKKGLFKHKSKNVPKYTKKYELKVLQLSVSPDTKNISNWTQMERQMTRQDILMQDTEEKKNDLEESIYALRSKLETDYSDLVSSKDKDYISKLLNSTEDWLYGDGEDTTIDEYTTKFDQIMDVSNQLKERS